MTPLLALALVLSADPLSAKEHATVANDIDKAQAEVSKKYGDRKLNELSTDERRALSRERADAERAVLDKAGISAKDWAKEQARGGREVNSERKEAKREVQAKEKAEAEAKAKAAAGEERPIEVQRGMSDANPVTIDERPGAEGTIPVETSLPADAVQDQAEAAAAGSGK